MESVSELLTEQEAAIYDRQIRIWGADAQRKLSKARILVVGITGVVAETCKNIVLAGIGSLVLMDDSPMTFEASAANFLVPFDELEGQGNSIATVCASSLRDFNPMVQVSVEEGVHKMQPGNIRLVNFLCRADLEMKSLLRNTYMQVCSIFCRIYRDTTSDFAL
jgi:tRNA A37 threonylcarbamoyladenosine dehydratase